MKRSSSHSSTARSSATQLTAFIMAQGLAATAHAALAPDELAQAAATDATKLDPVTVADQKDSKPSLPKFTEPLRDTPQTVVVIPSDVYTQQGATNLSEVLRNTPGITFAAGEGGGASATAGDAFYLRGFDASNNIFVDGVRDVGAYSRDVFNLEQVEVAKGSAGSDVGRGASSGYINVATKTPRAETFASATLVYGFDEQTSNDRRRASFDVNQSLAASPVKGTAIRLNALWQENGGIGRDYAKNKTWGLAPSLALGLGTPTRAFVSYQHTEQDNLPDYGLPGAAFPGFVSTPPPPFVPRSTYYGLLDDRDKVTGDAYTARVEHDATPDLHLSNQTRFSANERDAIVTTPGTNVASYVPATGLLTRSRQGNRRNTDILSNQTNLVARATTGKIHHDVTAGLEFTREQAYSPAFVTATLPPIPLLSPNPATPSGGTPVRSNAYTDTTVDSAAVYLFDTLKFNDRWQLNGGFRAERYTTDFLSVATTGVPAALSASQDILTWKTGLVFKPVHAGSLYLAYGLSEKPPGSDFTLSSAAGNQNNPDTDPQETKNAELGVKWEFHQGRLIATAAAFRTENNKTVYTDLVLGAIPAGRQTVEGIELGVSGKITAALLVFGGFAYLDSEYNTGTAAQIGTGLPLVPRVSGNLWTTYRLTPVLTLGGGAQYSGQANRLQTTAGAPLAMPSYTLVNVLAAYDVGPRLTLRINVNNALNRDYVQSYNNNGGRFMPGAPRSYLLTATLRF